MKSDFKIGDELICKSNYCYFFIRSEDTKKCAFFSSFFRNSKRSLVYK